MAFNVNPNLPSSASISTANRATVGRAAVQAGQLPEPTSASMAFLSGTAVKVPTADKESPGVLAAQGLWSTKATLRSEPKRPLAMRERCQYAEKEAAPSTKSPVAPAPATNNADLTTVGRNFNPAKYASLQQDDEYLPELTGSIDNLKDFDRYYSSDDSEENYHKSQCTAEYLATPGMNPTGKPNAMKKVGLDLSAMAREEAVEDAKSVEIFRLTKPPAHSASHHALKPSSSTAEAPSQSRRESIKSKPTKDTSGMTDKDWHLVEEEEEEEEEEVEEEVDYDVIEPSTAAGAVASANNGEAKMKARGWFGWRK